MAIAIQYNKSVELDLRNVEVVSRVRYSNIVGSLINARPTLKIQLVFSALLFLFSTHAAFAQDSFTEVLSSSGFMGSWETLNKFEWMGQVLSWIIVFFSITGMITSFSQMMIDYGYLSAKNLYDTVYEYQEEDSGSGAFGMTGTFKNTFSGKRGIGFNAFIGVGYSLLPNLKQYSSYNPTRRAPNLDEDDTILSYTLKTFIPRLMIVLFFVLAFNGTLAKGFAMFAEAGATAIDRAVSYDLSSAVDKWAARGEGYSFTLGQDGTETGAFAERLAKKIYVMTISKTGASTDVQRHAIGLSAENWVYTNILGSSSTESGRLTKLKTLVPSDSSGDAFTVDTVKNLKYDIVMNSNSQVMGGEVSPTGSSKTNTAVSISAFLSTTGADSGIELADKKKLYVHIFIMKGKKTESNFFKPTAKVTTDPQG